MSMTYYEHDISVIDVVRATSEEGFTKRIYVEWKESSKHIGCDTLATAQPQVEYGYAAVSRDTAA